MVASASRRARCPLLPAACCLPTPFAAGHAIRYFIGAGSGEWHCRAKGFARQRSARRMGHGWDAQDPTERVATNGTGRRTPLAGPASRLPSPVFV